MLFLLAGAVLLILFIACLNLANLLLARNALPEREMAMRAALGAGRHRLITQLLIEAALLSLIGTAAGLGIARVVVSMLRNVYSTNLPQLASIQIDWRVVAFTLGLCLITGLFFGLAPAVKATAVDLTAALKQGSRAGTSTRGTRHLRNILVVTEIAHGADVDLGRGTFRSKYGPVRAPKPGNSGNGFAESTFLYATGSIA